MTHSARSSDPFPFWAAARPGHPALVDAATGRRWSFGEVHGEVECWVSWLTELGVGRGDRVAVLSRNRPEVVFLILACGRLGALVSPLNWRLSPAELGPILARYRPALLIGEAALRASVGVDEPAWRDLEADVLPAVARAGRRPATAQADLDDGWIVLFTSGTTGLPKGAVLPHRQILSNAIVTGLGWQLRPDEIVPLSTPLFHTGGLNVLALPVWQRGGTVVLLDGFEPGHYLDVLAREQCTLGFAVPTQYLALTEHPDWRRRLPDLRLLLSGGAPCPPALASQIAGPGYDFREGFGLTEFGPNCFTGSDASLGGESGVVGFPLPMVAARIVDEAGADVANGQTGELWLRGPMAFSGYLDDPIRTAETLVEGWVRTGDLFCQDRSGRFVVRGRRKEMFISGAENVFPAEVEAVLASHPGVAEVSVVGVVDPRWGEVGRAFVVSRGAAVPPEDLLGFARQRLAKYKVPKSIVFLDALPRLGNGKCDRAELARRGLRP